MSIGVFAFEKGLPKQPFYYKDLFNFNLYCYRL